MESPFNFNDSLIKNKCDYGHVQIEQFNIGQDYELWSIDGADCVFL